MAGKKSKKKRQSPSWAFDRRFACSLAALAIIIFALYRFFQEPRGNVFILDYLDLVVPEKTLNTRFESVREEIDKRIRYQASRLGIAGEQIRIVKEDGRKKPFCASAVQIEIPGEASLVQVNAAIDRAVESTGAFIRSGREVKRDYSIEIVVGTKRHVTHRCYISRERARKADTLPESAGPMIAVVVDDFGFFNNNLVRDFLALKAPLTVTVIPGLKHSSKICRLAREAGKQVLCHLPMEPEKDADDVGDIPLVRVSMGEAQIEDIVARALRDTPGVSGINNHMGSRATADRRVMEAVLRVCRRERLFFFDSLTSPGSVVAEVAVDVGVRSGRNDLFLDNKKENTRENMKKLLSMAVRKGKVAAIMHVRRDSLKELVWLIEESRKRGIKMVYLSEMLEDGK
ncbi:MAG: divergent polysaccharide deacetylase family protein [Candidatus Krumholzibacteriota bacterium]|nr:divergent polysaccharide deacetylase family protein [Candidatus Krumholzibacteriota bacterium]